MWIKKAPKQLSIWDVNIIESNKNTVYVIEIINKVAQTANVNIWGK